MSQLKPTTNVEHKVTSLNVLFPSPNSKMLSFEKLVSLLINHLKIVPDKSSVNRLISESTHRFITNQNVDYLTLHKWKKTVESEGQTKRIREGKEGIWSLSSSRHTKEFIFKTPSINECHCLSL